MDGYTFMWIIIAVLLIVGAVLAWHDRAVNPYAAHDAHVEAELDRLKAAGIEPRGDVWKELGE